MSSIDQSGSFTLGDRRVKRLGYGAMQLAGPHVFGPPKDHDTALAVLRDAIASGVNHIDTSDFYGPHVTNRLIREALHPYRDDLVIVTKIGARRGTDASWLPAFSADELKQAVHDNLRNLQLDVLDVVNLRVMLNPYQPTEGSIEAPLTALAELQHQGLVRHIGLSNVTRGQIAEGRTITDIVCVQNLYNLAQRTDDALYRGAGKADAFGDLSQAQTIRLVFERAQHVRCACDDLNAAMRTSRRRWVCSAKRHSRHPVPQSYRIVGCRAHVPHSEPINLLGSLGGH